MPQLPHLTGDIVERCFAPSPVFLPPSPTLDTLILFKQLISFSFEKKPPIFCLIKTSKYQAFCEMYGHGVVMKVKLSVDRF